MNLVPLLMLAHSKRTYWEARPQIITTMVVLGFYFDNMLVQAMAVQQQSLPVAPLSKVEKWIRLLPTRAIVFFWYVLGVGLMPSLWTHARVAITQHSVPCILPLPGHSC